MNTNEFNPYDTRVHGPMAISWTYGQRPRRDEKNSVKLAPSWVYEGTGGEKKRRRAGRKGRAL